MPPRVRALWIAFLAVWAAALFYFGAVRPWSIAATALAMAVLYWLSLILLPDPPKLSKAGLWFLGGFAALLLLQAAPLPFLYPYTTRLRATHGVGTFWPGTADAFLSVRFAAQAASYVLAALLVLRLRQAGLSTSSAIRGLLVVAGHQAAWGVVRALGQIDWIPFYDGPSGGMGTGTLVNRNNFAGLCAMGLATTVGLAAARFTWPPRKVEESGRPALGRRLEAGLGWALLAALFAAAIVLSHSRGGALAAFAGLAVLPFLHRGRASAAGVVALLAAGVTAVVAANPADLLARFETLDPFEISADSRWQIWTQTARATSHQPLLGFGVGTHPNAFHPFQAAELPGQVQHAHSEYVNLFFEAGAVGLLLALWALGAWLLRAWRGLRPMHGPDRLPAAGVVAGVVALLVHSLVDFDLRITGVGLMGAALLGLGASLSRGGEAAKATCWATTYAGLALGALLGFASPRPWFGSQKSPEPVELPGLVSLKSLGLTPYDHALAWRAARASADPAKFELAANLFPAHPGLQRESGLAFWEAGDARAALCFRRLFAQKPEEVEPILELIHDPADPIADYEALLPGTSEAAARLAAFLSRRGDWKTSIDVWDRLVKTDATAPHDYVAEAFRRSGQWGLEARVRERRLEARSDAWAQGASAEAWRRLGVYDKALERASGAERIDPRNGQWSALKAEILLAKEDVLAAFESYTEAVRRSPLELEYRLRRAELALQQRTYQSAAEDFREVRRSRPDDRRATLGLVRALLGLTQKDSARALLDEWLAKHPQDGEAEGLRSTIR